MKRDGARGFWLTLGIALGLTAARIARPGASALGERGATEGKAEAGGQERARVWSLLAWLPSFAIGPLLLVAGLIGPSYAVGALPTWTLGVAPVVLGVIFVLWHTSPARAFLYTLAAASAILFAFNSLGPWVGKPTVMPIQIFQSRFGEDGIGRTDQPRVDQGSPNRIDWDIYGDNSMRIDLDLALDLSEDTHTSIMIPISGDLQCEVTTRSATEFEAQVPRIAYLDSESPRYAVPVVTYQELGTDSARLKCTAQLPELRPEEGLFGVGRMRYQLRVETNYALPVRANFENLSMPLVTATFPDSLAWVESDLMFGYPQGTSVYSMDLALGPLGRLGEFSSTIGLLALGALASDSWLRRRSRPGFGGSEGEPAV